MDRRVEKFRRNALNIKVNNSVGKTEIQSRNRGIKIGEFNRKVLDLKAEKFCRKLVNVKVKSIVEKS